MSDEAIDFIGIGVPKSGTTWLGDCLYEHPQVAFAYKKEVNFFSDYIIGERLELYNNGIDWYQKQIEKKNSQKIIRGEFSVGYYADPNAPARIKEHFPNVKLILCMRKPADMLYSLYWYSKVGLQGYKIPDSFEEFIEDKSVLDKVLYHDKLQNYLKHFDMDKIFITTLDDIKEDDEGVCQSMFRYLGVDEEYKPSILGKRVNNVKKARVQWINDFLAKISKFFQNNFPTLFRLIFGSKRLREFYRLLNKKAWKYPPMKESTRAMINEYVAEDIKKLETLLERELNGWY